MTVQYHGDACIRITGKNGPLEFTVLCDPYDAKRTGLKPIRPSAVDLVLSTTGDLPQFSEGPFVVRGPGEYEVKGVSVTGIPFDGKTIYRIVTEDVSIAFLGNIAKPLDDAALEAVGDVAVLVVPVGGKSVLSAKGAAELIEKIEPRIVVPIQYAVSDAKLPYETAGAFCKEVGCNEKNAEEKLKVTAKDLPSEELWVRMLQIS